MILMRLSAKPRLSPRVVTIWFSIEPYSIPSQAADSGTLNGIPVHRLERVTISERSTPEGIPVPLESTVVHTVPDHGLVAGDRAHLVLDWERRYANMKMHTAAHLLFAATREFLEEEGQSAVTKGCQIEGASARFDFRADIGTEAIAGIERRVRELAQSGLEAHVESADNGLRTWHLGEIEIPCDSRAEHDRARW